MSSCVDLRLNLPPGVEWTAGEECRRAARTMGMNPEDIVEAVQSQRCHVSFRTPQIDFGDGSQGHTESFNSLVNCMCRLRSPDYVYATVCAAALPSPISLHDVRATASTIKPSTWEHAALLRFGARHFRKHGSLAGYSHTGLRRGIQSDRWISSKLPCVVIEQWQVSLPEETRRRAALFRQHAARPRSIRGHCRDGRHSKRVGRRARARL